MATLVASLLLWRGEPSKGSSAGGLSERKLALDWAAGARLDDSWAIFKGHIEATVGRR